jgi:hypothetical protein
MQAKIKEIQHAHKALDHYKLHHTIGGDAIKMLQAIIPGECMHELAGAAGVPCLRTAKSNA